MKPSFFFFAYSIVVVVVVGMVRAQGKGLSVYDVCAGNSVTKKSADEVIAERDHAPSRIPMKLRDNTFDLPDSDLLKALHYYISHKYPENKGLFEESSLITMGLLVEQWMDEIIGETSYNMYSEFANKTKTLSLKKVQIDMPTEEEILNS